MTLSIRSIAAGAVAAAALFVGPVQAASIYQGYSAGAGSLAAAPEAMAAAASFDAATGTLAGLADFEAGVPADMTLGGMSITDNSGCGFALCGGNTTLGGSQFALRSGASILTFTFDSAITAFGAYLSGIQNAPGQYFEVNGTQYSVIGESNGGVMFWGITSDVAFTTVTYYRNNDIVAFDDVRYGNTSPVPLPAGIFLLPVAVGALAATRRRKSAAA